MGWGWAGWMLAKDINSHVRTHFVGFLSLTTSPMCLYCSLLFFPQPFHLDQMVSLLLCFPLSEACWSAPVCPSKRLILLPAYTGGRWRLGVCSCKPGWAHSVRTPRLPLSWRKLEWLLPKCKMVFIFLTSSTWAESTLSYLRANWPSSGFLMENLNARHLPLSSSGLAVLSRFSWSGGVVLCFVFVFIFIY